MNDHLPSAKVEEKNVEMASSAEKLRAAHVNLRHLLAASPVVIYSLRIEGQGVAATSISDNLERMFGFTVDEARKPDWWPGHLHPDDRERMLARLPLMAGEEQGSDEYRFQNKHGGYLWIRDDRRLTRDAEGRPVEIIGSWADITERKRAEQRTEVQLQVTTILTEGAPLPQTTKTILEIICRRLDWDAGDFWTLDRAAHVLRRVEIWHVPKTEFREFAEATRNVVFLPEEWLPGHVWASGVPVWIPDVLKSRDFRRRFVADRIGLHGVLALPVRLQNEVLGVLEFFSARVLPPDADMLALLAALGTQISQFIERKQLEDQFRQAQNMEAIGQLAGGVAHDFNNLLTVIQGHTQLLLTAENLDPDMADDLEQVFLASERAVRLTSQLLAFSRKQIMRYRPVDLNEIVAGVSRMLQRIIGEDVALTVETAPSALIMNADVGMLE
jgi:PAS domain S-box-containing protein